jgi:hypothetical protein
VNRAEANSDEQYQNRYGRQSSRAHLAPPRKLSIAG